MTAAASRPPLKRTSSCSLFKEEPRKVCFTYDLFLNLEGNPPVNHLRCEKLTFNNPTIEFRYKLLMAGGVSVPRAGGPCPRPAPAHGLGCSGVAPVRVPPCSQLGAPVAVVVPGVPPASVWVDTRRPEGQVAQAAPVRPRRPESVPGLVAWEGRTSH